MESLQVRGAVPGQFVPKSIETILSTSHISLSQQHEMVHKSHRKLNVVYDMLCDVVFDEAAEQVISFMILPLLANKSQRLKHLLATADYSAALDNQTQMLEQALTGLREQSEAHRREKDRADHLDLELARRNEYCGSHCPQSKALVVRELERQMDALWADVEAHAFFLQHCRLESLGLSQTEFRKRSAQMWYPVNASLATVEYALATNVVSKTLLAQYERLQDAVNSNKLPVDSSCRKRLSRLNNAFTRSEQGADNESE